jgi:AraC-like DNA-binding protein
LETTGKTIQQIATAVGYDSEASFNRAFKREFGRPPARYRKERLDGEQRSPVARP